MILTLFAAFGLIVCRAIAFGLDLLLDIGLINGGEEE